MTTPTLKPCPFCGDPMELWDQDTHARHAGTDATCPLRSHAILVEAWNRRAPAVRPHMGQTMAECDCPHEAACVTHGYCLTHGERE